MPPISLGFRQKKSTKQGANREVGQAVERNEVRSRHNALTCVGPTRLFVPPHFGAFAISAMTVRRPETTRAIRSY
jgi:hypothetical protein